MFDLVRGNKRVVQVVLAIIILPFAFFGIDSYFGGSGDSETVAVIAGEPIGEIEFRRVVQNVKDGMQGQLKDNPQLREYFDSLDFKKSVLDDVIKRKLLLKFAFENGMIISDDKVREQIRRIPAFQDDQGAFNADRYVQILKAQNVTTERFENEIREALLLEEIELAITDGAIVANSLAERLEKIRTQERVVTQYLITPQDFMDSGGVGEDEILEYFEENASKFLMPSMAKVEYVVLTPQVFEKDVEILDSEIIDLYNSRITDYQVPEQRKVSHILFSAPEDPAEKESIKLKAIDLGRKLVIDPNLFPEMAKGYSDDPASAGVGGDLGFFEKGQMPAEFDDVVFELEEMQVSEVFETEYGFHVAVVTDIRPVVTTAFEEVRGELLDEIRREKIQKAFSEGAVEFADLVYSHYDSLEPVLEKYKLELLKSDWITEEYSGCNAVFENAELRAALFSEMSINEKRNSKVFEIEGDALVSARIIDYLPSKAVDFKDVQNDIRRHLVLQQAKDKVVLHGQEVLEKLKNNEIVDNIKWSRPETVTVNRTRGLHPAGVRAVFSASSVTLPSYAGIGNENGKYVIYKISAVRDNDQLTVKDIGEQAFNELGKMAGERQLRAFLTSLRESANVTINDSFFAEQSL